MVILADQCINQDVIQVLIDNGLKVITTSQANLGAASDEKIFDYSLQYNHILLTFDKDFGNVLRFDIRNSMGVVIIYIEDMERAEIINNTLNFFKKFTESQLKGRLFIVEKGKVRIWPK